MKFISPLGGIQQTGASETAARGVVLFAFCQLLQALRYTNVLHDR